MPRLLHVRKQDGFYPSCLIAVWFFKVTINCDQVSFSFLLSLYVILRHNYAGQTVHMGLFSKLLEKASKKAAPNDFESHYFLGK